MNKITRQQLHALQVSPQIYRWFLRRFPQGGEYQEIHHALMRDGYAEWLESLAEYGYSLGFASSQFIQQETRATQAMIDHLTAGNAGVIQVTPRDRAVKHTPEPYEAQLATGDHALDIGCVGLQSKIALSGTYNFIGNSGENSGIASIGYACQLVSSGFAAKISNAGQHCRIGSLGGRARISNSGNSAKISAAGRGAHIANSGMRSYISGVGESMKIANAGDMCKIGLCAQGGRIANTGDNVSITVTGENSVVTSSGRVNMLVLGKGGCAALSYHDGVRTRFLVVYEGENGITAGVKYRLNAVCELEACD
ncbi:hypothetical protein BIY26_02635 [Brenneria goodwinii]|uniref:Oxidoreductase subunit n=1 Tax=Brenneria goodwinii TaxID=1109412 RepID=A0AAE8JPQ4_9GAMM|nr:protein YdhT [Brenneria goodwinii]ATA26291.1 hypothetical protein AWC36_20470 [Brenneria goodwinii]RLM28757.1 hypothetical protein BIY26_02635 [Brenneria goodwinii]